MPKQRATNHIDPNGNCDGCGQQHIDRHGHISCAGHVRFDREPTSPTYRERLPQPRPCQRPPRPGLERCASHGAGSKAAAAAGERRVAEQKAAQVMRRFGEPIDTTPTEALLDAVKWTAGYVAWLRDKVAGTDTDDALTQNSLISGKREASVWLDLLASWSDRLVKVCGEAIRCGIAERQVRLAERQGEMLAQVIRGVLNDLGLTAEQEAMVSTIVPRHLRAVAG